MEVLTAYVRRNAPAPTEPPTEEENEAAIKKRPRTEIQAILTVLGRRKRDRGREHEGQYLDLSDSDLRGASFSQAHLEDACFGEAHMKGASFIGAHLEGAMFERAHMEESKILGAHIERAGFESAHLEGAFFLFSNVEGALFDKVHLERAFFSHVVGLTVEQIQAANGWEQAKFDEEFRRKLEAAKQKAVTAEEDRAPLETPSDETHPAEEDAG